MRENHHLIVKGARLHNLQNINVSIPHRSLCVITGPSGSGKSSLAFDTIFAEGQRRYIESLSTFARQFIDQMEKPDVDAIEGLSPTIAINQKTVSYNPRSSVGTVTEIMDYLRVLYARVSTPICPSCGGPIQAQTPDAMVEQILGLPGGTKVSLLAPIVRDRKGEHLKELEDLRAKGFVRVRLNGESFELGRPIPIDKSRKNSLDVSVDRFVISTPSPDFTTRVRDSVDLALKLSSGLLILEVIETSKQKRETLLSRTSGCPRCLISLPPAEPRIFSFNSHHGACPGCLGLGLIGEENPKTCPECAGARLKKESLSYLINDKSIAQTCDLTISDFGRFLSALNFGARQAVVANRILDELSERLQILETLGLGYLTLSRSAATLSGGEAQRIRLATQLGSALVGIIYVLDEPSIGLHQSDNEKLLKILRGLRDRGNTILVVEHDIDTMRAADYLIDMGPGAGTEGGRVVAAGSVSEVKQSKTSLTGKYLSGKRSIAVPSTRRKIDPARVLKISAATKNNLKNVSCTIPLGSLCFVTGVSGSGKSSLVFDTLLDSFAPGSEWASVVAGREQIDRLMNIDQSPIGRTPRSNPATYVGIFTLIRDLYSSLPEAVARGHKPGRFSFNVKGGRCEACEGDGTKRIEMHFMPDVYVTCAQCRGRRYNRETLSILFKGKSIADVLEMTIQEASKFFQAIPKIHERLSVLDSIGLGYLRLGQSAVTLSGGEAQRMKLSRELVRRHTGNSLYLLDEPSTGLHFEDIKKLMSILEDLVDRGNTVIVIEHSMDMIKRADYIIDLGPGAGVAGGEVIACGTPEEVASRPESITGKYLAEFLG